MILCRALSYEENTLDKSLLTSSYYNISFSNFKPLILFIIRHNPIYPVGTG